MFSLFCSALGCVDLVAKLVLELVSKCDVSGVNLSL